MRNYNALEGVVAVVGVDGAEMTCHDASGEIVWTMGLEGGQHDAAQYRKLMQPDQVLALNGGSFVSLYQGRMAPQKHPHATDTGANPDWTPTQATALEQKMRQTLHRMGQQTKALDKRLAALNRLEAQRPAPDPEPVVEPDPEPAAEPENTDAPAKE